MRNRGLHDDLRAFALEAARLLREDHDAGAELEFELDEGARRGGPVLYHYRPLADRFVADRWQRLRMLPSAEAASAALGDGAAAYLRVNGLRGGEPEPALRAMLERLYEDSTDFAFPEERFERVYADFEETLYEKSVAADVLAPVYGLELESDRVELGEGLTLVRGEATDAPDEAVWGDPADPSTEGDRREPNALVWLHRDVSPDDPMPARDARVRFRRLLTGLRLFRPGGIALASLAWRRSGDGRWTPFELEPTGAARGGPWALEEGAEDELRAFLSALRASRRGGAVAWALSRFEMGAGRRFEAEALSDYLLALRALLDPAGEPGRSRLAMSVAVLCAHESERKRVQRRVELAQALERFVMGDGPDDEYLDSVGSDSPATLVEETERHLRALLRDVMCGFLDPDLGRVADDLMLKQAEPFEIRAWKRQQDDPELEPAPEPVRRRRFAREAAAPIGVDAADVDRDDPAMRGDDLADEPFADLPEAVEPEDGDPGSAAPPAVPASRSARPASEQDTDEIDAVSPRFSFDAELEDPGYWSAPV